MICNVYEEVVKWNSAEDLKKVNVFSGNSPLLYMRRRMCLSKYYYGCHGEYRQFWPIPLLWSVFIPQYFVNPLEPIMTSPCRGPLFSNRNTETRCFIIDSPAPPNKACTLTCLLSSMMPHVSCILWELILPIVESIGMSLQLQSMLPKYLWTVVYIKNWISTFQIVYCWYFFGDQSWNLVDKIFVV